MFICVLPSAIQLRGILEGPAEAECVFLLDITHGTPEAPRLKEAAEAESRLHLSYIS